jgi:hypothetical protein
MTPEQRKCSVFPSLSPDPHLAPAEVAHFPALWETVIMAKRSLRILKRVSSVPSLGVCESCSAQFSADPRQLGQSGVQQQFNAHKCEASRNAAPDKKEAAKVAGK